jgi:phosphatidylserine/phosphatidylglycerophosphate/cardiolipin synthase-like enzyme
MARAGWIVAVVSAAVGAASGALLRGPAEPPAELHFAPGENLERVDVGLLDEATRSIDMAAYVLTDRAVIAAIERAGPRGVKVRIWRDPGMIDKVGEADVAELVPPDDPHIALGEKAPGPLMHLKGYCVDGHTLRTGSANFSRSGLVMQDNDLVVLRSTDACAAFEAKFARAWNGG